MPHFTITEENRDDLLQALNSATDFLACITSDEPTWLAIALQLADYLEAVEDYTGDGDQLVLGTSPISKFAPLRAVKFDPPSSSSFLWAMENTCQGLEKFIALCPYCGWGEFLNAVRATLDNARAAV